MISYYILFIFQLSKALEKFPGLVDEVKITLMNKSINRIDRIPYKYNNIEELQLSNNAIASLEGIEQFKNLSILGIANNQISDVSFLRYLKSIQNIQHLNMKGNPVCKHPTYKLLVLSVLPNLTLLDEQNVSIDDRTEAEIKIKQQSSLIEMMVSNYCLIIQLNSFNKKLDLHKNLFQIQEKFALNFGGNKSVNQLKKVFVYEAILDQDTKELLRDNLMTDLYTLYEEINEKYDQNQMINYELAFTELLSRQKQKIAELELICDKKLFDLGIISKKAILAKSSYSRQTPGKGLIKENNSKIIEETPRNNQSKESFNQKILNKSKKNELINHSQNIIEKEEEDNISKNQEIYEQNQQLFFLKDEILKNNKSSNKTIQPQKNVPKPSQMDLKPLRDGKQDIISNQDIIKSSKKSEKQKDIVKNSFQLSNDLNDKLDEISNLDQMNKKYKIKIKEYYDQNNNNIKLAKEEIETLQQECIQNEEQLTKVKNEAYLLRQQYNESLLMNYSFEKELKNLQNVEEEAQQYAILLNDYRNNELLYERAIKFDQQRIQKLLLQFLEKATKISLNIKQFRFKQIYKQAQAYKINIFFAWRNFTNQNKTAYLNQLKNIKKKQKKYFFEWQKNIFFQKNVQRYLNKWNEKILFKSFSNLKLNIGLSQNHKQKLQFVDKFSQVNILNKFFCLFKLAINKLRYQNNEEQEYLVKADNFYSNQMKLKIIQKWKIWYFEYRKNKISMNQQYREFHQNNLIVKSFQIFRQQCLEGYKKRKKIDNFINQKKQNKINLLFVFWKQEYPLQKKIKKSSISYYNCKLSKICFFEWKKHFFKTQKLENINLKSNLFYQQKLKKRIFQLLISNNEKSRFQKFLSSKIKEKTKKQKQVQFFVFWKKKAFQQIQVKINNEAERIHQQCQIFREWYTLHMKTKIKKERNKTTTRMLLKLKKQKTGIIFQNWKYYIKRKTRNQKVVNTLLLKNKFKVFRVFLIELLKINQNNKKDIINKVSNQQQLIVKEFQYNLVEIQQKDEERTLLSKQLASLDSVNQDLQNLFNEKEKQFKQQQQIMIELENKEYINKQTHIQNEQKAIDLEAQIDQISTDYQSTIDDRNQQLNDLDSENIQYRKKFESMKQELLQAQQKLHHSEKNFLSNREKIQTVAKDQEEKLKNSLLIAGEFKQQIIKYEDVMANMNKELDEKISAIQLLKSQISESEKIINTQQIMYEKRLEDSKRSWEQSKAKIEETQEQTIFYQKMVKEMNIEMPLNQMRKTSHYSNPQARSPANRQQNKIQERIGQLQNIIDNTLSGEYKVPEQQYANLPPLPPSQDTNSENLKSGRKKIKDDLEQRIRKLNYNLESDLKIK